MKEVKIPIFNKMNKKCYNNNTNSYQRKDIHLKKLQNTSENVKYLLKKELKLKVKKKKNKSKKIIDIKEKRKIYHFEI